MKTMKKLLSIVMVLTLVLALGISALAADITINDKNATGSKYKGYQLMTVADAGKDSKGQQLFRYTLNETYRAAIIAGLKAVGTAPADDATGDALVELVSRVPDAQTRAFADAVYANLGAAAADFTQDAAADGVTTFTADDGYYLIVEETTEGIVSLVMLDTMQAKAGNAEGKVVVDTKEDKPTYQKKVKDINDSTETAQSGWQDSADWDIGDDVPFQLTGTLPANYANYEQYYLAFHDKESDGLTFNEGSVAVYVDGTKIESGYEVVFPGEDGCTFDVIFDDVKAIASAGNGSVITVEYTARLNEDAVIGSGGNPNQMHMEYSNNPYDEAEGKPGTNTTPDDKVIVFTYEFDADKVDGNKDPLAGAAFTLYKKAATGGAALEGHDGNWTVVKEYEIGDGTATRFEFAGLDDGEYVLVETVVPDGFNKADDIEFTISAEHETDSADPKLTEFKISGDVEYNEKADSDTGVTGKYAFDVVNLTGLELPSTGGIGTTIFYVVGAILVAGAVILLVTKRRVNGENK